MEGVDRFNIKCGGMWHTKVPIRKELRSPRATPAEGSRVGNSTLV